MTGEQRDEAFMRLAIEQARLALLRGQTPFGAVIVKKGQVIVASHNKVWAATDITAHAEVSAIREACAKLGQIHLTGTTIYSTTEPCPMCFSACHWAKVARIVYGASIRDAAGAGFNELHVSNRRLCTLGPSPVRLTAGVLRRECRQLFAEFLASKGKVY